jgi:Reverse transcriptase (RNA-dependent DNA polymerase)
MRPLGGGAIRSNAPQPDQDQVPFGDIIQDNTGKKFRIVLWNSGGFPVSRQSGKSKVIEEAIRSLEADVICLTETNVNWNKVTVHNRLHERFLGWWQKSSLNIAHYALSPAKQLSDTSAHQYGGVALCSVNDGAARVVASGQDSTGLGRWAWTQYQGKHGQSVRVVTAYRCNRPTPFAGSVYNQQKAYFEAKDDDRNPRDAFWEDLVNEIRPWMEGHFPNAMTDQARQARPMGRDHVVVAMDMNEDVREHVAVRHLSQLGLKEIITHRHGQSGPRTCNRGSTPIDGIFVTAGLLESKCGYLAVANDHRRLWLDLDTETVFGAEADISPRFKPMRLQNSDRRSRDKYVQGLLQLLGEEEFTKRLDALFQEVVPEIPLTQEQAEEFDYLLKYHDQAAKLAEKRCRKLHTGKQAWTPQYTKNRDTRLFWIRLLGHRTGKKVDSRYLQRLAKKAGIVQPLCTLTVVRAMQGIKAANAICAAYAKHPEQERERFMIAWGAAEEAARHIPAAKAIKKRLEDEKARRDGRIIGFTLGKSKGGGVQKALKETPTGPQECNSKTETEQAFLDESSARFRQADSTPALTSLFPYLGRFGLTEDSERILNGTFVPPSGVDFWTLEWLKEMQRPPNFSSMAVDDRTLDDHAAGWSKARERTSSSPFGLRFAHYMAHTNDSSLSEIDYRLSSIPLITGCSPLHWQQGMNAWLLKKPEEFRIAKMRTILLYDASFNQNNKWIGRSSMRQAEQLQRNRTTTVRQAMAPEQYGSRKHHQAIDQCLNKRLTFDISRQLHGPMALCANDAKSCYDRIVHSVASLCMQRIGCPKPAVHSMFETLQHLRHHVRTRYGDSQASYNAADSDTPIQGLGQGNGAGPTIWALISTPVLNLLRTHGFGIKIISCISGDYLHFVGYCFVDDTDLVEFPGEITTAETVANSIQQAVDAWEAGIRATGGAIVPDKSHWYLIAYKWEGGAWRYTRQTENPFELTVRDEFGTRRTLQRLGFKDAERTLGARIAPNGSCAKEKRYLRDCAEAWADHIRTGRLPRSLSWKALLTTIMRTLLYPMPVTYFTRQDCDYIMAPVLRVALSHSGVCRTIPRAIVYAPLQYQGLAVPDLFIEQGISKLVRLLKFGRASEAITSNLLRHSGEAMKLELGLNGYLFQHDFTKYHCISSPSWMKEMWRFLVTQDICVEDDLPELGRYRQQDRLLMEAFSSMDLSAADLYKVNICRLHLQATTLADITDGSGVRITANAWNGIRALPHTHRYRWGAQPRPSSNFWVVWKRVIGHLCGRDRQLLRPLGQWMRDECTHWIWWYDTPTETLFSRMDGASVQYTDRSARNTRQAVCRFHEQVTVAATVPMSATPCTVVKQGQFLLVQGTAAIFEEATSTATSQVFASFPEYLASINSNAWVFDNIQIQGSLDSIIQSIRTGTCSCVTDGSFKDNHGTAAWKIVDLAKPEHVLEGQVVTPGYPHQQDAYRSELSGLYASVVVINSLTTYYQITGGSITLACDNISAGRMSSYNAVGTNPSSCAHYDLVMAIQYIKTPRLNWIHQHVKGHQDDRPDHILTPMELINVEMDTKAKHHWTLTRSMQEDDRVHSFGGQPWSIVLGGEKIVSNLTELCKDWCQRPRIQAYWIEKGRFRQEQMTAIEFTTSGLALRREQPHTRRWVTKLASGYCGVNKWMYRWKRRDSQACPRCQDPIEDVQHMWLCQGQESPQKWVAALTSLALEMQQLQTDPVLASMIISRLRTWQVSGEPVNVASLPERYQAVVQSQDAQGWHNFWIGLPSKGWQEIQADHYKRISSPKTGTSWLIAIIRKQWLIAWDIWDYRNQVVHHIDEGTDIQRVATAIRAEYALGAPSQELRKFFRTPLREALRRNLDYQTNWLHRVVTSRARSHRKDRSLRRSQACMAAFVGRR